MNQQEETVPSPKPETTKTSSSDRNALVAEGRRHPATIALIEEISAQVAARSERRIDLASARLRAELARGDAGAGRRNLIMLGTFATVNLSLMTAVLALGLIMAPWLAGVLVTAVTAGAFATALRISAAGGARMLFLRRLGARRFVARLFASA